MTINLIRSAVTTGAALLLLSTSSYAAERNTEVPASDKHFMNEAAQAGLAEVKLGKIAVDRASDAKVKQFAQMMVDDHSGANEKLMKIAANKNVSLPAECNAQQQATAKKLEKLSGAEFDRMYVDEMVKDHKKAIALFEKEAASSDPELMAFAKDTLPTLRKHLQEAEALPVHAAAPKLSQKNDAGNRTHTGKPKGMTEAEKTEHDLKQEH